jgi:hypothetical protein
MEVSGFMAADNVTATYARVTEKLLELMRSVLLVFSGSRTITSPHPSKLYDNSKKDASVVVDFRTD